MGTTQYHLSWLEKTGKITSSRRGLFKYFFPAGTFQDNEKALLEILSHETARQILILIIEGTNPTQSDIAAKILMTAPSVNWHVRRLVESGVIAEFRDGKYKRYQLRGDPKRFVSLMKTYYPSLWDTWSDRLAEIFLSLSKENKEP